MASKPKSQDRADDIQITWNAHAVVLTQVKEILSEVFVEHLACAGGEAISHPAIDSPVVEDFVSNK